jgi:hypothetical protein
MKIIERKNLHPIRVAKIWVQQKKGQEDGVFGGLSLDV